MTSSNITAPTKATKISPNKPEPEPIPSMENIQLPTNEPTTPMIISPTRPKVFLTTLSAKKPAIKPTINIPVTFLCCFQYYTKDESIKKLFLHFIQNSNK
jgi:hypothetical protein